MAASMRRSLSAGRGRRGRACRGAKPKGALVVARNAFYIGARPLWRAPMAELVDASDSKSDSARSAGSIPARGTTSASDKIQFCPKSYFKTECNAEILSKSIQLPPLTSADFVGLIVGLEGTPIGPRPTRRPTYATYGQTDPQRECVSRRGRETVRRPGPTAVGNAIGREIMESRIPIRRQTAKAGDRPISASIAQGRPCTSR